MNNIQQEQIYFQQQIGLKFKEETDEMLKFVQSFLWNWNFGIQIRNTLQVPLCRYSFLLVICP